MRRRSFIAGLGSAAAWPLAVRGQQGERVRRVGVLVGYEENDRDAKVWLSLFMQGLAQLGWTDGRNLRMDIRWPGGDVDRVRMLAKEIVDLRPDVILSISTPVTAAVRRETQTIPIVFAVVGDPVGDRFVASLSRPGGNVTGFMVQEPAIAGRWLEMLTQLAPRVTRPLPWSTPRHRPAAGPISRPSSRPPPAR
jgi:putative tryptophan/tyrosine transport system substrate-binding protein